VANIRIYQYTSIGRPLDPAWPTNKAVLILLPVAAVLGAVLAWRGGEGASQVLLEALVYAAILFLAWALAREFDPDDQAAAFISAAAGLAAAVAIAEPGILLPFVTLLLVRIVNRSTGLAARRLDSVIVTLLSIAVVYLTPSPLFGCVAALAFMLDGSLKEPLRQQWLFGFVCLAASIVYMVDHDLGPGQLSAPDSLFQWLSLLFLLIFALDTLLTRKVRAQGDVGHRRLDPGRVRGGMAVGLAAALQGIGQPDSVVVVVAAIAGICIGLAFRKGFRPPRGGAAR
jgi:hypothetical protein